MVTGEFDPFMSTGSMIGKYQIVRRLAVGGMAELFLARTQAIHGFQKLVVLKRILPQYAENPDFVRMFLDEARLAASLDHQNIAHVYDIGDFAGSYFFSMEFVHGQSLLKVMRAITTARRPLPLEHALYIVAGCCAGLHYAHEKVGMDGRPLGIVHRDVSPPNVIITYDGSVKVLDFGIAKAATAQAETKAGTLKGKIPYMSPEQCRAEELDRRSDVFSIGILLYELTVGRRLFQSPTEVAIIHKICSGDYQRPSEIHPSYPPELEAIVLRALELEPSGRYATARELQFELEEFAREYKLAMSSARLATFMEELFDEQVRQLPTDILSTLPEMPVTHEAARPSPTPPPPVSHTPPPASPSPPPTQPSSDMAAFDDALSRLLSGQSSLGDSTLGLGEKSKKKADDALGIDLDNLELEDLVPSKFTKD